MKVFQTWLMLLCVHESLSQMVIVFRQNASEIKEICNDGNELSTEIATLRFLAGKRATDEIRLRGLRAVIHSLNSRAWSVKISCEPKATKLSECSFDVRSCSTPPEDLMSQREEPDTQWSNVTPESNKGIFRGSLIVGDPTICRLVIYNSQSFSLLEHHSPRRDRTCLDIVYCSIDENVYWILNRDYMTTTLVNKPQFDEKEWKYKRSKGDVIQMKCDAREKWYFIATRRFIYRARSMGTTPIFIVRCSSRAIFLGRNQHLLYYTVGKSKTRKNNFFSIPYKLGGKPKKRLTFISKQLFGIDDRSQSGTRMLSCRIRSMAFTYELASGGPKPFGDIGCFAAGYDKKYNVLVLYEDGNVTSFDSNDYGAMFTFNTNINLETYPITLQVLDDV